MIFSALWLLLVYAPVARWVWGGGWLQQMGLLDFAGGTVVHITAGVAALVAALVIGNRNGFGQTAMPPHNMTMTVTGAGMLWVRVSFQRGQRWRPMAMPAWRCWSRVFPPRQALSTLDVVDGYEFGKPSALGVVTGMVAGPEGNHHTGLGFRRGPTAALVIGTTAGLVCFFATLTLKRTLKIDDSLDVFPVHGVGGILGTLAVGVFASSELGVFSGQGLAEGVSIGHQLLVQIGGILAVGLYTALLTWGLLRLTGMLVSLRVSVEEETEGLDIVLHNERGYDL